MKGGNEGLEKVSVSKTLFLVLETGILDQHGPWSWPEGVEMPQIGRWKPKVVKRLCKFRV